MSFNDEIKLMLLLDLKAKLADIRYDRLGLKDLYHIRAEVEQEIQRLQGEKKHE